MIVLSDHILTPLGEGTAANLQAVREGRSALCSHSEWSLPEPFVASLFSHPADGVQPLALSFEEGLIRSISAAVAEAGIDAAHPRVGFVLSSTKGNVSSLEAAEPNHPLPEPLADQYRLGASARRIASHFGNPNTPVVVSNACISGLSAQILALRLLQQRIYDYVIVAGYDVQSRFIVSGFQSFKALSPEPCRPFDGDRCGLNLGEAVATLVLAHPSAVAPGTYWQLQQGAVRNDAVHISNPSRTGEGSLRAIRQVLPEGQAGSIDCISAHGTATLFNDEMEAAAIARAGLSEVPVFSLKGYYGHTMGAAGILETILTLHALDEGWIPATRGYAEEGTSHAIRVTSEALPVAGHSFLKLLSGFGGCNAAALFRKGAVPADSIQSESGAETISPTDRDDSTRTITLRSLSRVHLFPSDFPEGLTAFYKQHVGDYPKFYKMDPLCKLGFLATECLVQQLASASDADHPLLDPEHTAVVLINRSGSLADDLAYQDTIRSIDDFYPSPSVFVYTLSNILTGELAIRHGLHGETSCFIIDQKDPLLIRQLISTAFLDADIHSVIGGWVEYADDAHFEADIDFLVTHN